MYCRLVLLVLLACILLSACGSVPLLPTTSGTGEPPISKTAGATATPKQTPPPTPSPTPTQTSSLPPTLAPTPTAAPTATPDPWAGFFSDKPVVNIPNAKNGPWVYRDKDLSITVKIVYANHGRENYVAEIYTRGQLPTNGFADKKNYRITRLPWYVARVNKAVLGVTADYLSWKTNKKGVMLRNGKMYYDKKDNDTLAILPSGEFKLYDKGKVTARQLQTAGVKDSYSFGPWLVRDGKVNPNLNKHRLNNANSRCSIGMVEPGHYFFVVSRNVTLAQHAQIYIGLKCKIAYNLDGGNSCAMVFMGEQLNEKVYDPKQGLGQRPVPELLFIGTSSLVPGVKAPVKGYKD